MGIPGFDAGQGNLFLAYALIAIVLIGYGVTLYRRSKKVDRELES